MKWIWKTGSYGHDREMSLGHYRGITSCMLLALISMRQIKCDVR